MLPFGITNSEKLLKVFKSLHADLVTSLEHCILQVAIDCYSKKLISKETRDVVIQRDIINSEKASILLGNVEARISQESKAVDDFMIVLTEIGDFSYIVDKIRCELSK